MNNRTEIAQGSYLRKRGITHVEDNVAPGQRVAINGAELVETFRSELLGQFGAAMETCDETTEKPAPARR